MFYAQSTRERERVNVLRTVSQRDREGGGGGAGGGIEGKKPTASTSACKHL